MITKERQTDEKYLEKTLRGLIKRFQIAGDHQYVLEVGHLMRLSEPEIIDDYDAEGKVLWSINYPNYDFICEISEIVRVKGNTKAIKIETTSSTIILKPTYHTIKHSANRKLVIKKFGSSFARAEK